MRQNRDNRLIFCAAAALLLAAFGVSLCIGRYPLGLGDLIGAVMGKQGMAAQVFWRLRLPRSLAVCASGVALGACGAVYQTLFGNPLAAPDIMGVSGGATLGAAVAIVMLGGSAVALAAFTGGMAALAFSLLLTRASGARGTGAIVLSGILVSALSRTGIMLLKTLADTEGELASIEFFTMGSFAGITSSDLPVILAGTGAGLLVLFVLRRQVALLTLSDEEAVSLGVHVGIMRVLVLTAATLMVCTVSARAGVIAFLPLIAPHGARMLLRGHSRGMLPLSALAGGVLLLLADGAARLTPGAELPVSVLTTLMGVPVIGVLMVRGGVRHA